MFVLRANVPPDRWWLRLKFQFLVVRDHVVIFIIVQLVRYFLQTSYCLLINNTVPQNNTLIHKYLSSNFMRYMLPKCIRYHQYIGMHRGSFEPIIYLEALFLIIELKFCYAYLLR